jgi:serine/threonine protein kinase
LWKELDHPNILPFLGVDMALRYPTCCLVSPWMKNGNVLAFIKAHPDSDRLSLVRALVKEVSALSKLTSFVQLRDVLEGLQYLHSLSPPVAHGDVKCVRFHIFFVCSYKVITTV